MKRRKPLLPAAAGQGILKFPVVSYRRYRIISSGSDLEIICINYKKKEFFVISFPVNTASIKNFKNIIESSFQNHLFVIYYLQAEADS